MSPPNPGANNLVEFWSEFDDDAIVIAREDVGDFNAENILPQDNNTLQHILTWLNPTNYDDDGSEYQKHISSHLPGTGDWVFESEVYQQWHDSNEHGILWVRGMYYPTLDSFVLLALTSRSKASQVLASRSWPAQ